MTLLYKLLAVLFTLSALASAYPSSILRRDDHLKDAKQPAEAPPAENAPANKDGLIDAPNDVILVLQFALFLEFLEAAFYRQGFEKFPAEQFLALGLSQEQIEGLIQIGETEQTHVETLTKAISGAGSKPGEECTYNFGFTDAKAMLDTARVLEAVGVAAYLGAAPLIANDVATLGVAASIVTVESRHQTLIRTVLGVDPVPRAFDVAVDARQIFTLASAFVVECPAGSNLPFEAFPSLNIVGAAQVTAGSRLVMGVEGSSNSESLFCSFRDGEQGVVFAPFEGGACTVPDNLGGEVFLTISTSGEELTDETVVAGPAVLAIS